MIISELNKTAMNTLLGEINQVFKGVKLPILLFDDGYSYDYTDKKLIYNSNVTTRYNKYLNPKDKILKKKINPSDYKLYSYYVVGSDSYHNKEVLHRNNKIVRIFENRNEILFSDEMYTKPTVYYKQKISDETIVKLLRKVGYLTKEELDMEAL